MTRYACKRDGNAAEIVDAWQRIGATVIDLAPLGRNVPDAAVFFRGQTWMVEIKNPHGKNRVSKGQQRWLDWWPGPSGIVRSPDEAIALVTGRGAEA